jgi:hypothetical protein
MIVPRRGFEDPAPGSRPTLSRGLGVLANLQREVVFARRGLFGPQAGLPGVFVRLVHDAVVDVRPLRLAEQLRPLDDILARRGVNCLFTSSQVPFERLVLGYLRQCGLLR